MKTIFKPALLALATVFTFGSLISCDQLENPQKENEEQTEQQPEEQPEQQPEQTDTLSVDGKQWSYAFNYGGMMETTAVLDLGVTNEGIAAIYMDMGGMYYPGYAGTYTITATDGTSGTITLTDPNDPSGASVVFTYSNLTEDTVTLSCNGGEAWTMANTDAKAIEMSFDDEEAM